MNKCLTENLEDFYSRNRQMIDFAMNIFSKVANACTVWRAYCDEKLDLGFAFWPHFEANDWHHPETSPEQLLPGVEQLLLGAGRDWLLGCCWSSCPWHFLVLA